MINKTVYAAIRKPNDEYSNTAFVDLQTISDLNWLAEEKVNITQKEIPSYALANPVIRIAKFQLTEINE